MIYKLGEREFSYACIKRFKMSSLACILKIYNEEEEWNDEDALNDLLDI